MTFYYCYHLKNKTVIFTPTAKGHSSVKIETWLIPVPAYGTGLIQVTK